MEEFYKNCQVFTPDEIVRKTLDIIGYERELFGKKVLENSCGDGQYLLGIVERYIKDCLENELSLKQISNGIEQDIYGTEIDEIHYKTCLKNLECLRKYYNLPKIKWNILLKDFLKYKFDIQFDYIIGNPPYITYSDLDVRTRNFIKDNFNSCKFGKPDYYYAFVECSIKNLSPTGILAYLIPNNIFKNKFAADIRNYIKPYLTNIYDYDGEKLFKKRLTTSSIIVCKSGINLPYIDYLNIPKNLEQRIEKTALEEKWIFSNDIDNSQFIFGDYFKVSVSVATLCNDAFVINDYQLENGDICVDGIAIENDAIRRCASPRSLTLNRTEYIIFPYIYNEQGILKKQGEFFEINFPNAVRYLNKFKDRLDKRKSDSSAKWFEYGRSQALSHINQEKLLISTLVSNRVRINRLEADVVPYSGIVITAIDDLDLDYASRILQSDSFLDYVNKVGIKANGVSVRISPVDIKNYKFNMEDY